MPELHEEPLPRHPHLSQLAHAYPEQVQRFRCADGDIVLSEGELSDAIYFLEEGALVVEQSVGDRGARHVLKVLVNKADSEQLMPFGEMSHIVGGKRTATIRSSGMSIVVRLDVHAFENIYRDFPDIARTLNLKLVERLNDSNARLKEMALRLEPPVQRLMTDSPRLLVRKGEVTADLWQCVAGVIYEVDKAGARMEIELDADGFLDPLAHFRKDPAPRTLEAATGSFLVLWKGSAPGEVFRFYPELALRLVRGESL